MEDTIAVPVLIAEEYLPKIFNRLIEYIYTNQNSSAELKSASWIIEFSKTKIFLDTKCSITLAFKIILHNSECVLCY